MRRHHNNALVRKVGYQMHLDQERVRCRLHFFSSSMPRVKTPKISLVWSQRRWEERGDGRAGASELLRTITSSLMRRPRMGEGGAWFRGGRREGGPAELDCRPRCRQQTCAPGSPRISDKHAAHGKMEFMHVLAHCDGAW